MPHPVGIQDSGWVTTTLGSAMTWFAHSGSPVIGNGTCQFRWRRIFGALVWAFYFAPGSTTTFGASGPWTFELASLPIARTTMGVAATAGGAPGISGIQAAMSNQLTGSALAYSSTGGNWYTGVARISGDNSQTINAGSSAGPFLAFYFGSGVAQAGVTVPFTWTAANSPVNDLLIASGTVESLDA